MKIRVDTGRNINVDRVLETLEKSIVTGKIKPGERLSEARLAKQLGVSRIPVREALIRLEELQLVRKNRRGREVARVSPRDLSELYEIKALFEAYSAGKGSQRGDLQSGKKLRALVDKMDASLEPLDYSRLRRVNHRFHNLLVESGGNKKLYAIYLNVVKQLRWTTHISLARPGRPELSNREHREICEAYEKGEGERVERLIRDHTRALSERVLGPARKAPPGGRGGMVEGEEG